VIIDVVQKAPQLLDLVHKLIKERQFKFALTGSSARKLKRGAANLLAGRAFVYNLFPMTLPELKDSFSLEEVL
jgi:predicted AAA+ superfamily ATPase